MRLVPGVEIIGVVTPSVLSRNLAFRALRFSEQSGIKTAGIIENLENLGDFSKEGDETAGCFKRLASLPYDKNFEAALGDVNRLRQTDVYRILEKIR
jgi:Mrp family chromosome partitioning ATPase